MKALVYTGRTTFLVRDEGRPPAVQIMLRM